MLRIGKTPIQKGSKINTTPSIRDFGVVREQPQFSGVVAIRSQSGIGALITAENGEKRATASV
jgi:hypothetical protein